MQLYNMQVKHRQCIQRAKIEWCMRSLYCPSESGEIGSSNWTVIIIAKGSFFLTAARIVLKWKSSTEQQLGG